MNTHPYFLQQLATDHGRRLLAEADRSRLVKAAAPRTRTSGRRFVIWPTRRSTQLRPSNAG
jgi:hypothetical protein